jgi:phage/plasmid-like protein (TIGR03299 family)
MSANVETMFYVLEKPWHGLGTMVQEAPTSADALRLAGLDWTVEARDMWLNGGYEPIPGYKANVRSSDNKVLGVVSDKYRIVQNADAFAFTDALIGGDVHYETAGSLLDGKKIWLLAKLPDSEICGDKTEPYVCFSNTHDGSGAVRVCMTPVRVVCNNTLNLALNTAQRAWSVRHVGDISTKLVEAQQCLEMAGKYMDALAERADQMANTTVSDVRLRKILDELFPEADDMSNIQKRYVQEMKDGYMVCVMAPDLAKFRNTAWGAVNAMSDFVTHSAPHRNTKNYQANNWNNVMGGHWLIDAMTKAVSR